MSKRLTTEEFIKKAKIKYGDKYDYSLVDYKNSDTKVKVICPKHGVFESRADMFIQGQSCPKCGRELNNKKRLDRTFKKVIEFNNNKYIIKREDLVNYSEPMKMECKEHGIFYKSPSNFFKGQGCPKCSKFGRLDKEKFLSIANKLYGDLYSYPNLNFKGVYSKVAVICSKHGEFVKTIHDFLRGSGCPYCQSSHGEIRIRTLLKEKGIEYESQKKFKDLKDKKLLSYDFYIPSKNLLIEYNGFQHYNFKSRFYKTVHDFHKQLHHDWLKRKYAKDNGYKLLTIPYWNCKILDTIIMEEINAKN